MTPSEFRRGGADAVIRFAVGECSLGSILVAATDRGVCSVLLGDDAQALVVDLERRFPRACLEGADAGFEAVVAQVVGLVERPSSDSESLPLDLRGTAFQKRVWAALSRIPRREVRTYAQIAEAVGSPRSTRAVAGACAANPIAVAVPCHRVVRTDGSLSGYRWGVEPKEQLLERERARKKRS